jgi:hypothetical protein
MSSVKPKELDAELRHDLGAGELEAILELQDRASVGRGG